MDSLALYKLPEGSDPWRQGAWKLKERPHPPNQGQGGEVTYVRTFDGRLYPVFTTVSSQLLNRISRQ